MKPSISVVVPNRGRVDELRMALRSVMTQTLRPLEVLVVDDGSPNYAEISEMVAREFGPSVRMIENQRKPGAAGARNAGILSSCGQLVAFLDSDDEWLPPKLEEQLAVYMHLPRETVVGAFSIVKIGHRETVRPRRAIQPGERIDEYLFNHGGYLQTSTLLVPRCLLESCLFNEDYPRYQDLGLLLRLQEQGARFEMVPRALAVFNLQPWELVNRGWSLELASRFAQENRTRFSTRAWHTFLWNSHVVWLAYTQGRRASLHRLGSYPWRGATPRGILSWLKALMVGRWKRPTRRGRAAWDRTGLGGH